MDDDANRGRWGRRPRLARAIRVLVFVAPVAASVGAAALVRPLLPPAVGVGGHFAYLLALVAVSTAALVVVDRLARRALPLATLLDLSMLFPDGAPSRLRVARAAIKRAPIEEQLARVARAGADPGAVAREILTLVAALSAHDRPTRGHAERVRMFTDLLAEELKIPERDRDLLRWAAILHDVGKLRVPTTLLNKPGKPTPDEWDVLRAHPAHGADIAGALLPWLGEWGAVIVEHHERYDGTGYPTGLAGREISQGARIVSVADAFDVMTAARAYKRPVSRAAAYRELVRFSGSQFDPVVVRAMLSVGAPRLRRAQGVLAWLSDIPLVATASVPAATVARVVGAGALATGAVAGGVSMGVVAEPAPPAHTQVLDVAEKHDGPVATVAPGAPASSRTAGAANPGLVEPEPARTHRDAPTAESAKPPAGTASDAPDPVPPAPPAPPPPPPPPRSQPTPTTAPPPATPRNDSRPGVVGEVLKDPKGTVTNVVKDPVGTVTGTVDDVLADPVGTVTGTVDDTLDTVDDTLGTLLGSGSSGSGSSGSGSSGSGSSGSSSGPSSSSGPGSGGLLGGLLGR